MKIRLIEPITFRSAPLPAGREIDLSDLDAQQLIAAGHAEAIADVATSPAKTQKPAIKEQ